MEVSRELHAPSRFLSRKVAGTCRTGELVRLKIGLEAAVQEIVYSAGYRTVTLTKLLTPLL